MLDDVASTISLHPDLSVEFEQCVNYEETLQRLCNLQLQRDYYISQHPKMESTDIDFLTNEAIQAIKLNDKGLCDYAVQFSEREKLSSKRDVASVAYAVYHEKSKAIIARLMDRRNALLQLHAEHQGIEQQSDLGDEDGRGVTESRLRSPRAMRCTLLKDKEDGLVERRAAGPSCLFRF